MPAELEVNMCILPEMICYGCLTESFGQLLRYPVEEVEEGLRLCARHKEAYLAGLVRIEYRERQVKTQPLFEAAV